MLVSTSVGRLGGGGGGGVELTLHSLISGLNARGYQLTLVAPEGSQLTDAPTALRMLTEPGIEQPSWQHADPESSIQIPRGAVLPRLWDCVFKIAQDTDAVINLGYDWLPLWLTPIAPVPIFHLVSMGAVATVMQEQIEQLARWDQRRLAFHSHRQAADFRLPEAPVVVGNGFNLSNYTFRQHGCAGPLGWAGRIAPEKGLEDAAAAAAAIGEKLLVWGIVEDSSYAHRVETSVPTGTISWQGFLSTAQLQDQLGRCRALINTPKWNEAYGNVIVEAMACGVPVIAYDRGGPGELIKNGVTGWLVPPDDIFALAAAIKRVPEINRASCRHWVEHSASCEVFAQRVEDWLVRGLTPELNVGK